MSTNYIGEKHEYSKHKYISKKVILLFIVSISLALLVPSLFIFNLVCAIVSVILIIFGFIFLSNL